MLFLDKDISKGYGSCFDLDHVLCFVGAEEGIYSMAQALLTENDHAIVVTPCYQSLESLPASICPVTAIPLEYRSHWGLDVSRIADAITERTKLILINFLYNPTGALISAETQNELVHLARKYGIWIFSDEVYRLLEINPEDRIPPIASVYEKGMSFRRDV